MVEFLPTRQKLRGHYQLGVREEMALSEYHAGAGPLVRWLVDKGVCSPHYTADRGEMTLSLKSHPGSIMYMVSYSFIILVLMSVILRLDKGLYTSIDHIYRSIDRSISIYL